MNRREWITALATAVTSGSQLTELLRTDAVLHPEPPSDESTLQDIFPDPEWRIPDEFEDVTEHSSGWRSNQVAWEDNRRLKANYARRRFRRTTVDGNPRGEILLEVIHPDDDAASTIDDHHENALWRAFGGSEPHLDRFTDWADVVLTDIELRGNRVTHYCNRIPQIYSPTGEPASEKPYSEYVLLLQSIEDRVLKVEIELQNVSDGGRSLRIAEPLLGEMRLNCDFW